MVLVTAFMLLRELHKWLTRNREMEKQSRLQDKEKLKSLRLKYSKMDNVNNNTRRWLRNKSTNLRAGVEPSREFPCEKKDVSEIQKELASVRAVLEIREEELRKLRWKIDRSQIVCDVKHIQTQTQDDTVNESKSFATQLIKNQRVHQNQNKCDLGQRGWSVHQFIFK